MRLVDCSIHIIIGPIVITCIRLVSLVTIVIDSSSSCVFVFAIGRIWIALVIINSMDGQSVLSRKQITEKKIPSVSLQKRTWRFKMEKRSVSLSGSSVSNFYLSFLLLNVLKFLFVSLNWNLKGLSNLKNMI